MRVTEYQSEKTMHSIEKQLRQYLCNARTVINNNFFHLKKKGIGEKTQQKDYEKIIDILMEAPLEVEKILDKYK